jgi:hypothetical protein
MPFDFSKPLFFDAELQKKGVKAKSGLGGVTALSLGVDPAIKYHDLPFDCGNFPGDGSCCFNSMVGYPEKNRVALPIFDYEQNIVNDLDSGVKYLCVKKARGIGISELFLRYMTWLGLTKNEVYKGTKFFIVCGPGENTAIELIKRIKLILFPLGVLEETERTVCRFLDIEIQAKPGSHVSTLRGYTDIKFILVDEASFWTSENEGSEVRSVTEGYIAKSHPVIAMVSTPNLPNSMFEGIMEEPDSTCLYKRYRLDYTVGLGKIYSQAEIEEAKRGPHFEREYNLKYGIGVGNIFADKDIDDALIDEIPNQQYHSVVVAADPGFGSSNASYVVTAQIGYPNTKVIVLDAAQFERSSFRWFSDKIIELYHTYKAVKIFVDASQRDVVDDLKMAMRERTDYENIISDAQHNFKYDRDAWMHHMIVCPIAFNKYNDRMVHHLVYLVINKLVLIPRKFDTLVLDLRMAKEKGGKLDKTSSVNKMDLFDALRMACLTYEYNT